MRRAMTRGTDGPEPVVLAVLHRSTDAPAVEVRPEVCWPPLSASGPCTSDYCSTSDSILRIGFADRARPSPTLDFRTHTPAARKNRHLPQGRKGSCTSHGLTLPAPARRLKSPEPPGWWPAGNDTPWRGGMVASGKQA